MLCAELLQHSSIVVALANSMSSQNSWSYIKVPAHPCEDRLCTISIQEEGYQLSVKSFISIEVCLQGGVHTDDGDTLVDLQWET